MTEPTEPRFNLVDEPWLPVIDAGGRQTEVSVRDAFRRSGELRRLVGDLPTQAFAHLRLLLAVLHRAVEGPADADHWAEVRDGWDATLARVDAYLDAVHDRFWLRHPTHPFLQVPDLRTAKDEVFGLSRIVCDGPGTSTFMTTRLGDNLETASWPEAARWLVHAHAFDVSGIHSGAVDDPRVSSGKGFGIGTGWAGQIGGVHLHGATLRETLLLNLIAPDEVGLLGGEDDLPAWERAPLGAAPEGWPAEVADVKSLTYRQPTGPVDLYTWPTRRIRLFGDDERCTGVVNAQGDRATPHNRFDVEPMTSWRYSPVQTKARGAHTYMPAKHDPERAFWRGLSALIPGMSEPAGAGLPSRRRSPAVIEWAVYLRRHGLLGAEQIDVQAVGIEYGSNESVYAELVADTLTLPTALLTEDGRPLADVAVLAVDCAEKAVFALGSLAQNVALAAGGASDDDGPRDRASAEAYDALDREFRRWVTSLRPGVEPAERRAVWQRAALGVVQTIARDVIAAAGPAALVGRTSGGQFRDVGIAERWFRKKLREVLPHAFEQAPTTAEQATTTEEVA
ncbi:type I-E CRISPR-associated protein Cse1/CasA [Xylanimonas protaetiae]|uniref:Type I-E CRISPR-associated protein Cse1/CasA n=1 Tax=Xylanimonas protaetiae TaxID=2509457 RepID=A0A4P6F6V9_9MICO|nr:type I-E CRISPR-associated protein Cse1/CasA [Xylanimonas protaetiae]QAY71394.1 type I-E CRISPR-associated protein Cse1/CasA [Xylanimonas protaetiae]